MTEQEWLDCLDPRVMLEVLRGSVSDRKARLFACACCRRAWSLLHDVRSRQAIEAAERYADKHASEGQLRIALEAALAAHQALWDDCTRKVSPSQEDLQEATIAMEAAVAVWRTCKARQAYANDVTIAFAPLHPAAYAVAGGERGGRIQTEGILSEYVVQASILRDIFANPFRLVAVDQSWLKPNVVKLAQAIYEDRHFQDLPVLADALEKAGCADAEILGHCRGAGLHVRGCWVLDVVLGKQ
jgi:hypothetical protein